MPMPQNASGQLGRLRSWQKLFKNEVGSWAFWGVIWCNPKTTSQKCHYTKNQLAVHPVQLVEIQPSAAFNTMALSV